MSKYNRIPCEELLNVVRDVGLDIEEQAAYFKCTTPGTKLRVYVAKNKRPTRVYFSGFTVEHEGAKLIPRELAEKRNLGSFQSQLDFTQDNDTVLAALREGCETVSKSAETVVTSEVTAETLAAQTFDTVETPETTTSL